MTLGANTFFVNRSSRSYCYIGQVNYWLTDEQRTRLTASVYCGPNAIFAAPDSPATYDTMVELRVQQDWSPRFTQVVQSNMGWDSNTPVGTGSWYGRVHHRHLSPAPTNSTSSVARNGSTTSRGRGRASTPTTPRSRAG